MLRRTLLIGASAGAALLAAGPFLLGLGRLARAQDGAAGITEFDQVLGDADAPVAIFEYASFTCPHCAAFHTETLPDLEAQFIESGQAKLVFRHFPLNQIDLRAGMLLRCAPEGRYFSMASVLFEQQQQWASAPDPIEALRQIGMMAGISKETIDACMADQAMADQIIEVAQAGQRQYGINSTPSFVIGDEVMVGARPLDEFAAAIDSAAG
ncbi:MAG TPA: DsbA family protein [Alphaproteobacteria bacterium]|nr:DsbA family protein [Alphaproteobacteria bacterium]